MISAFVFPSSGKGRPVARTDDEIVASAAFPILEADYGSREEGALAVLADDLAEQMGRAFTFVVWPDGQSAMVCADPGDRSGEARSALIAIYKAARGGYVGALGVIRA